MRAVEYLRRRTVRQPTQQVRESVSELMSLFTEVITFTPDRHLSSEAHEAVARLGDRAKLVAALHAALRRGFFEELYVDREEREKLAAAIPAQRAVVVHGFPGVGKTILLMKLCRDLMVDDAAPHPILYLDLAGEDADLGRGDAEGLHARLFAGLYSRLLKEYGKTLETSGAWLQHCVDVDPDYADLKQWLLDWRAGYGEENWQQLLAHGAVNRPLVERPRQPRLATLVSFAQQYGFLGFCLDNVDSLLLETQRQLFQEARLLAEHMKLTVLVAARTLNLRRIGVEQVNQGASYIHEEQVTWRIHPRAKNVLKDLLGKRLDCVAHRTGTELLNRYFKAIGARGIGSFPRFRDEFWKLFDALTKTFVEDGVGDFCNGDLRQVMLAYFSFISTILLNPEGPYTLSKLLLRNSTMQITDLRTFFFRWLVLDSESGVPSGLKVPNILRRDGAHFSPDYAILSYLLCQKRVFNIVRVTFSQIGDDLGRIGFDREALIAHLEHLAEGPNGSPLGYILVDRSVGEAMEQTTQIELLDKGEFFLTTVCVSREYVFWATLFADLPEGVVTAPFDAVQTYDDSFKLEVVLSCVRRVLVPFAHEQAQFLRHVRAPASYEGDTSTYFLRNHAVDGKLYVRHLLDQLQRSLEYMVCGDTERQSWRDQCSEVSREVAEAELAVKSLPAIHAPGSAS